MTHYWVASGKYINIIVKDVRGGRKNMPRDDVLLCYYVHVT